MAHYEASAIYLCSFEPKLLGHLSMSKQLTCAKIQLYLPSQSSSAIFQTFCQIEGIVKEVLAMVIKMSWNFVHSFMWSYYETPPNFRPIQSSMWAQDQILDSGNIFRLWSKCTLYCFINSEKIPDCSTTQITSLHQIWHHFIEPLFL